MVLVLAWYFTKQKTIFYLLPNLNISFLFACLFFFQIAYTNQWHGWSDVHIDSRRPTGTLGKFDGSSVVCFLGFFLSFFFFLLFWSVCCVGCLKRFFFWWVVCTSERRFMNWIQKGGKKKKIDRFCYVLRYVFSYDKSLWATIALWEVS